MRQWIKLGDDKLPQIKEIVRCVGRDGKPDRSFRGALAAQLAKVYRMTFATPRQRLSYDFSTNGIDSLMTSASL